MNMDRSGPFKGVRPSAWAQDTRTETAGLAVLSVLMMRLEGAVKSLYNGSIFDNSATTRVFDSVKDIVVKP